MRVITNEAGRAIQRLNPDEVRPAGGYYVPDIIRLISERYGFGHQPSVEDVRKTGAVFREGRLIAGTRKINIGEIGIYNDSVIATSEDTESSDFILNDILAWAQQSIGLRRPQNQQLRLYENALVVEFDTSLEKSFSIFDATKRSFEKMLVTLYGEGPVVAPYRFAIAVDSMVSRIPPGLQFGLQFQIERRIGVPFSLNRFYSVAPLRTKMHVELLEEFEKALG